MIQSKCASLGACTPFYSGFLVCLLFFVCLFVCCCFFWGVRYGLLAGGLEVLLVPFFFLCSLVSFSLSVSLFFFFFSLSCFLSSPFSFFLFQFPSFFLRLFFSFLSFFLSLLSSVLCRKRCNIGFCASLCPDWFRGLGRICGLMICVHSK